MLTRVFRQTVTRKLPIPSHLEQETNRRHFFSKALVTFVKLNSLEIIDGQTRCRSNESVGSGTRLPG